MSHKYVFTNIQLSTQKVKLAPFPQRIFIIHSFSQLFVLVKCMDDLSLQERNKEHNNCDDSRSIITVTLNVVFAKRPTSEPEITWAPWIEKSPACVIVRDSPLLSNLAVRVEFNTVVYVWSVLPRIHDQVTISIWTRKCVSLPFHAVCSQRKKKRENNLVI